MIKINNCPACDCDLYDVFIEKGSVKQFLSGIHFCEACNRLFCLDLKEIGNINGK